VHHRPRQHDGSAPRRSPDRAEIFTMDAPATSAHADQRMAAEERGERRQAPDLGAGVFPSRRLPSTATRTMEHGQRHEPRRWRALCQGGVEDVALPRASMPGVAARSSKATAYVQIFPAGETRPRAKRVVEGTAGPIRHRTTLAVTRAREDHERNQAPAHGCERTTRPASADRPPGP